MAAAATSATRLGGGGGGGYGGGGGGGARWGGGVRYLFRSKPPHPLSARLVAAEELGHLLEQRLRVGGPR